MGEGPLRIAIAPIGRREISEAFRAGNDDGKLDRAERRRAYRDTHKDITAWVVVPGTGPVLGRLVDMSVAGVAIALAESTLSAVDLDEEVELQFQGPGAAPVRVKGRFVELANDATHDVLRFAFSSDLTAALASPALKRAFNRRRAKRIEPDPTGLPMDLLVDAGHGRERMMPVDVSTRGLGLRCDARVAARFPVGAGLRVDLGLPEAHVQLIGVVRNQRADAGSVRVGIEFERTKCDPEQLALVGAYVKARVKD